MIIKHNHKMKRNKCLDNFFTIKPRNKKEQKEFAEFRNTDVGEMIQYCFGFNIVATLVLGAVLIYSATDINAIKFISQVLITMTVVTAWLIGMRFPAKCSFLIAFAVFGMHLITALSIDLILLKFGGTFVGMQSRIGGIYIYSLILAPSMRYIIYYTVVFYINITQTIYRHVPDEQFEYYIIWLLMALFMLSFWIIFQKRELKRFY